MIWAEANDLVESVRRSWVLIAVGIGLVVAVLVLIRIATSRKRKPPDLEKSQREDLAEYPPPPPAAGRG